MMGEGVLRSRVLSLGSRAVRARLGRGPARTTTPISPRPGRGMMGLWFCASGAAARPPVSLPPPPLPRGRRGGAGLDWPAEGRRAAASAAAAAMATEELAGKLSRRLRVEGAPEEEEEGEAEGSPGPRAPAGQLSPGGAHRVFSPYGEFREFSRRQIKDMERLFRQYDAGKDGFIDLMELKLMMEKLGAPQTHLGLKNMIKEVDEDVDSKLSFREFLLIFRKAAAGELEEDSGLHALACLSEIDVSTQGVKGAKSFFEAKVQAMNVGSRFEEEIKAEQEEKRRQAEELKQRKEAFKELQSTFRQ
ncbi:EF-hand domain-containing protein D2 isoform X1 [Ahaetulla prasina]|uniref:EF-hand domain-containing protein D2 isoform X1 n=1 Tax=Ahaetulla prasina TaxID=499056 RepID=UPI00264844E3|nr:EF-hand domain-containing protein D2 isoform X1 [Ahaetulla prasina]